MRDVSDRREYRRSCVPYFAEDGDGYDSLAPEVGPRGQRTLAACDLVDLTATVVGRNALPAAGAAGTVALAGGAAAVELWAAGKLG